MCWASATSVDHFLKMSNCSSIGWFLTHLPFACSMVRWICSPHISISPFATTFLSFCALLFLWRWPQEEGSTGHFPCDFNFREDGLHWGTCSCKTVVPGLVPCGADSSTSKMWCMEGWSVMGSWGSSMEVLTYPHLIALSFPFKKEKLCLCLRFGN